MKSEFEMWRCIPVAFLLDGLVTAVGGESGFGVDSVFGFLVGGDLISASAAAPPLFVP